MKKHHLVTTAVAIGAFLALSLPSIEDVEARSKSCPPGMASIRGKFCIDQYEAATEEILTNGKTRTHSPFSPVTTLKVRAVSKRGGTPQGYISRDEAEAACVNAQKRLCSDDEWMTACKGKKPTKYPYGDTHRDGYCNDKGESSFNHYYGTSNAEPAKEAYSWDNMNDARLNQMPGSLAPSGAFKKCRNGFDVYDMVGNLHEWTANKGGTFRGGYYLDTSINGEGCDYKTTAHNAKYHDYSTGFRCCK